MTVTIATTGGDVLVAFSGCFNLQDADSFDVAIFADGSEVASSRQHLEFHGGALLGLTPAHMDGCPCATVALVGSLAAGSHTFTVQWSRTAGTARAVGTNRRLSVVEIPQ